VLHIMLMSWHVAILVTMSSEFLWSRDSHFTGSRLGELEMHDFLVHGCTGFSLVFQDPTAFSCFCWAVDTYLQCVSRTCRRRYSWSIERGGLGGPVRRVESRRRQILM
jgi:hypothetical protein